MVTTMLSFYVVVYVFSKSSVIRRFQLSHSRSNIYPEKFTVVLIFPAALLNVNRIKLHIVSRPSAEFDGNATVTFRADAMGSSPDNDVVSSSAETKVDTSFHHCPAGNFWLISSDEKDASRNKTCVLCTNIVVGDPDVSMLDIGMLLMLHVHGHKIPVCASSSYSIFLVRTLSGENTALRVRFEEELCRAEVVECHRFCSCLPTSVNALNCFVHVARVRDCLVFPKGLNCSAPGASTTTLPVKKGYWRAANNVSEIRECFNQVTSSQLWRAHSTERARCLGQFQTSPTMECSPPCPKMKFRTYQFVRFSRLRMKYTQHNSIRRASTRWSELEVLSLHAPIPLAVTS